MSTLLLPTLGFTAETVNQFCTRYKGNYKGHRFEILETIYKGADYSLTVDGKSIFVGLREQYAREEIRKFAKKLQEHKT